MNRLAFGSLVESYLTGRDWFRKALTCLIGPYFFMRWIKKELLTRDLSNPAGIYYLFQCIRFFHAFD